MPSSFALRMAKSVSAVVAVGHLGEISVLADVHGLDKVRRAIRPGLHVLTPRVHDPLMKYAYDLEVFRMDCNNPGRGYLRYILHGLEDYPIVKSNCETSPPYKPHFSCYFLVFRIQVELE